MRVTVRMHAMPDHVPPRASWDADKAAPPNGILWQTAPYNRGIDARDCSHACNARSRTPRVSWDADKAAPPNDILWQTAPYNRGIDALKHSDDCQKASVRV